MTKADIISAVQQKMGFSRRLTSEVVDDLFEIIKKTLLNGESVKISGFGNLEVREKNARRGRNPRTGEEITISARKVLRFKPSQVLRKAINNRS
ncbi:MAG: integration host factor subunit alpha [Deltaproteobacteria bacterium]|nr:integration host factor subunit alpha [Deltaproteobacteria bacterium]MBW2052405.1 integration host factor subunit alpha [Deltaproteobacteria bacterium]MBW2140128.1 integration host factor subunit alpha [Deltaproteobacteria bacterium]MBW2322234.1 integration host factor subunit alpha [Deltaproteobacteria bacterium]